MRISPRKQEPKKQPRVPDRGNVFVAACIVAGLPPPFDEWRFDDVRKWRFDWAWPTQRIAIEIQGGIFSGGRHVRGAALLREMEKLNAAAILGWRILYLTPKQFAAGDAIALVQRALGVGP